MERTLLGGVFKTSNSFTIALTQTPAMQLHAITCIQVFVDPIKEYMEFAQKNK